VQDALRESRARPADFGVLVTDLSMPRMPGLDFAREALTVRPDITAAITCGYARPEDNAQARLLGVGDIMLKPTTVDQMAITLGQFIAETRGGWNFKRSKRVQNFQLGYNRKSSSRVMSRTQPSRMLVSRRPRFAGERSLRLRPRYPAWK
jgi:DNA-binding NtrC family response regulator